MALGKPIGHAIVLVNATPEANMLCGG